MADNPAIHDYIKTTKPIVMIGLMGAGKSRIGRELAAKLNLPFVDADDEIIKAAGCSISDIFELYGEEAFRDVEKSVICRLLEDNGKIISTGGLAPVFQDATDVIEAIVPDITPRGMREIYRRSRGV